MFSRVKSRSHLHVVTCTKWQRWCKSHWDFCSFAAAVRWQNRPPLLSFETRSSLRVFVTETALHPAQRSQVGTATNNKKKEKQKHVYLYKFTALNFGVGVSSCGRNFFFFFFLMEANENKRHSASPWESAGAMPKEPGNHNGVSRHKRLAYPSEYSRWCPSHLCCASYILAPAHTDERGGGGGETQSGFPVSVIFFISEKPLVQCISHNLCLSSLVPRLTSTNRLTLQAYVHMAALIAILHGGAL